MTSENLTNIKNKFVIGVVTYHPNEKLIARLSTAITQGFEVYVFDNSPHLNITRNFCNDNHNCRYFTCGKNVGLGYGISMLCAQAYYDKYSALLFFDQDTIFDLTTLEFIDDFYNYYLDILHGYSAIVFNSKKISDTSLNTTVNKFFFKDVLMAINSGSLYFLENLNKINWHNETYFVDCVDYEFCLNSNNNNFKIGECSLAPGFDHETEQDNLKYSFFGKTYLARRYSMSRIIDSCYASLRLIITAIRTRNIIYTIEISRIFAGYLVYQLIARLITKRN